MLRCFGVKNSKKNIKTRAKCELEEILYHSNQADGLRGTEFKRTVARLERVLQESTEHMSSSVALDMLKVLSRAHRTSLRGYITSYGNNCDVSLLRRKQYEMEIRQLRLRRHDEVIQLRIRTDELKSIIEDERGKYEQKLHSVKANHEHELELMEQTQLQLQAQQLLIDRERDELTKEFQVKLKLAENEFRRKERSLTEELELQDSSMGLPDTWIKFTPKQYMSSGGVKLINLELNSPELAGILSAFYRTCATCTVVSVERVQNPSLYRTYTHHRAEMRKRCKSLRYTKPIEQTLFHGTKPGVKQAIAAESFDPRLNGSNGNAYGKGTYFATEAGYSSKDAYASPGKDGLKVMFIAYVLVGRYAMGHRAYTRPPISNDGILYDSVVNFAEQPSIFVLFDPWHAYPAYAITFRGFK